jgi:copper chaperone NosL
MPISHDNNRLSFMLVLTLAIATMATSGFAAESLELPDGSKVDLGQKCPVCGMIVGGPEGQGVTVSYRKGRVVGFAGVAATVFKDGKVVGFDGARCLFVFNSIPSRYGADIADIKYQFVSDFSSKKMIKVEKSFLVLGSNVKGRMGYEMIPFKNKQEASKFASEHDGKWIVQLHSVSPHKAASTRKGKVSQ